MATNLRLRATLAAAVKSEAARTGRSQQDVMRDAIESYLGGDGPPPAVATPVTTAVTVPGTDLGLIPPRTPWRQATERIRLDDGTSSIDLLDRDDRI
ncbi:MAG: CopG family transcriptional regulator [Microbacteriaceae bacterium]